MRRLIGFVMMAVVGAVALVALVFGLLGLAVSVVWSLLTGRKPAAWVTWTRMRQASRQFRTAHGNGPWAAARQQGVHPASDVVDVQAHEVRHVLEGPQPPSAR